MNNNFGDIDSDLAKLEKESNLALSSTSQFTLASFLDSKNQPVGILEPSQLAANTLNRMTLSQQTESILSELRDLHSSGKVLENLDSMLLTQAVVLNRLFHQSVLTNDKDVAIKASEASRKIVETIKKTNQAKKKKSEIRFNEKNYLNEHGKRVTEYYDKHGDLVMLIDC
jgi:hypothetical protein